MDRRHFLLITAGLLVFARQGHAMSFFKSKAEKEETFPFRLDDAQWKARLTPDSYRVLRQHGTESAFSSPLNNEKRHGVYSCAGCDYRLFLSENKFDSGTGWPSFWQPASPESVGTRTDYRIGLPRTEVHCANCGGHLGHVFDDGPQPTGKRYCMNGVALVFTQQDAQE